ncbi:hypothetical protein B5S33_g5605 [[Candida] boidinii]|nr:hypothetical protein B5S33_g5605 [[Candida] boidinii]
MAQSVPNINVLLQDTTTISNKIHMDLENLNIYNDKTEIDPQPHDESNIKLNNNTNTNNTNNNNHNKSFFYSNFKSPNLEFIFEGEDDIEDKDKRINSNKLTNSFNYFDNDNDNDNHNNEDIHDEEAILIELQKDGETLNSITSRSSNWRAYEVKSDTWEFIDNNDNSKEIIENFIIKGSKSELSVDESNIYDLVPKGDLEYINRLVNLFDERNNQLINTLQL